VPLTLLELDAELEPLDVPEPELELEACDVEADALDAVDPEASELDFEALPEPLSLDAEVAFDVDPERVLEPALEDVPAPGLAPELDSELVDDSDGPLSDDESPPPQATEREASVTAERARRNLPSMVPQKRGPLRLAHRAANSARLSRRRFFPASLHARTTCARDRNSRICDPRAELGRTRSTENTAARTTTPSHRSRARDVVAA
jgi:hypothetical protein